MTVDREIWITGLGAITPIGCGADFFPALCQGKNGVGPLTRFDTTDFPTRIGAVVNEPFLMSDLEKPLAIRFALAASAIAWQDAGLGKDRVDPLRVGVILGTSRGLIATLEQRIAEFIQTGTWMDRLFFPHFGSASITQEVAAHFGARGPVETISAACASSAMAIGEAVQWIRRGLADIVITGGTEAPFSPACLQVFVRQRRCRRAIMIRNGPVALLIGNGTDM
nr:beta-ketoacyl synthase N-terminal-like domain-containing protein [Collibacillus ludicampi]